MKVIKENISNELIIKNSKFITLLIKINEDASINDLLQKIRINYPSATHYCYAYITKDSKKSSDDGEPGGTAGLPMLNVLIKNDLTNILAVTIRYFGGIKLGAGGLVRAYTKSLTKALENTKLITLEEGYQVKITINYDMQKELDYLLKNKEIIEKDFKEQITYLLNVSLETYQKLTKYNPIIIKNISIEKEV